MKRWHRISMLAAVALAGCGDDFVQPADGADTAADDAGTTDDAPTPDDGTTTDDAAPADDGGGDDGAGPGNDPCSGNEYTPTTPTTERGASPGTASSEQRAAAEYVSDIRNLIGMNPIDFIAAINQAAQAHSDYCSSSSAHCPGWHDEVPGDDGFTGAQFWERMAAAGYTGSPAFEVMAPAGSAQFAIDMWMATVYHRTPFVTPEIHETGYGSGSSYTTMDFGCCGPAADLVLNYPVHGQTGVATSWGGNEGPTPPAPPGGFPSGPVLTIAFPSLSGVHVTAHEIFGPSCAAVAHVSGGADITPNPGFQTDFLRNTVVLYPNAPLSSGTTYTVNLEYTRSSTPGHRTFSFTTQ